MSVLFSAENVMVIFTTVAMILLAVAIRLSRGIYILRKRRVEAKEKELEEEIFSCIDLVMKRVSKLEKRISNMNKRQLIEKEPSKGLFGFV